MNALLLGNIICFIGALFMVAIGFIKQREKILIAQSLQFAIMGAGNLILGGVSGFISNMIGLVRNLFCLKHELPLWLGCAFVALQAVLTFSTNSIGLMGWMPVVAALLFTLSINSKNEVVLKGAIILGEMCWLLYDITMHNYSSVMFDIFTIASNAYGIFLLKRGKK